MPNRSRDQVNGRSLVATFARCERRLNTVVILKGAPECGGPISMGQSYAQNFPKPSRPEREARSRLARAPRRICNNQTARRANQLRSLADQAADQRPSRAAKRMRGETHLLKTFNEISRASRSARDFSVFKNQKSCIMPASRPHERDASRSSRTWRAGCGGRVGRSVI